MLKRIIHFLRSFFWIVPFICFFTGYIFLHLFFHQSSFQTPALKGHLVTDALQKLTPLHLNARILSYKHHPHLPENTVLAQVPSETSRIRQQQTIFLILSTKKSSFIMPHCVGEKISTVLKNFPPEISPKIFAIPHQKLAGTCLAQFPIPDTIISNHAIILYEAKSINSSFVLVPSFQGQTASAVAQSLANQGFIYQFFPPQKKSIEDLSSKIIIDQKPLPGSYIEKQTPPLIQLKLNN